MERLTRRINNNKITAIKGHGCNYSAHSFDCQDNEGRNKLRAALEKLADYEDLEENYAKCGNHYNCEDYDFEQYLITWCEKYCPNGYQGTGVIQGTVSIIKITYDAIIVQIIVESGSLWKKIKDIFLTKEAAEAALKENNKNKGE